MPSVLIVDDLLSIHEMLEAVIQPTGFATSFATDGEKALVRYKAEKFDLVLSLEVVEHVADRAAFVRACARLVSPGGMTVLSTISRTFKAYALAVVGAERVLRWLPPGTHNWDKFVRPHELARDLRGAGLQVRELTGMVYNPLADRWSLGMDLDINYLALATKPVT